MFHTSKKFNLGALVLLALVTLITPMTVAAETVQAPAQDKKTYVIPDDGSLTGDLAIIDTVYKTTYAHKDFAFIYQAGNTTVGIWVDKNQGGYAVALPVTDGTFYAEVFGNDVWVSTDDVTYIKDTKDNALLNPIFTVTDSLVNSFDYTTFQNNLAGDAGATVYIDTNDNINGNPAGSVVYDYSTAKNPSSKYFVMYYNLTSNDLIVEGYGKASALDYTLVFKGYDDPTNQARVKRPTN